MERRDYIEILKVAFTEGKLGEIVTGETPVKYIYAKNPTNKMKFRADSKQEPPHKHHSFTMTLLFWNEEALYMTKRILAYLCVQRGMKDTARKVILGKPPTEFTDTELEFLHSISDIKTQIKKGRRYIKRDDFIGTGDLGAGKFHADLTIFEIYTDAITNGVDTFIVQLNASQNIFFKTPITKKEYDEPAIARMIDRYRPMTFTIDKGKQIPYIWEDEIYVSGSTVIAGISIQAHKDNDGVYTNLRFAILCNMVSSEGGGVVSEAEVNSMLSDVDLSSVKSTVGNTMSSVEGQLPDGLTVQEQLESQLNDAEVQDDDF